MNKNVAQLKRYYKYAIIHNHKEVFLALSITKHHKILFMIVALYS